MIEFEQIVTWFNKRGNISVAYIFPVGLITADVIFGLVLIARSKNES